MFKFSDLQQVKLLLRKNIIFCHEILFHQGYYFLEENNKIFSWFSLVRKNPL
jgi:hypothetical protein